MDTISSYWERHKHITRVSLFLGRKLTIGDSQYFQLKVGLSFRFRINGFLREVFTLFIVASAPVLCTPG